MTDAAARLARRYPPPRTPRRLVIGLVALGSAIGLAWLIWVALLHAEPVASAQVPYYKVTSDTSIEVTITVQRRDPSVPVTCRVLAQSTDFQPVAELEVPVEASSIKLVDVPVTLVTLRRATSASVSGCTPS
ncbi:DUF4307 domain-containing protein [uncultured Friedmanniella sp.]|uniref:DUF4307 domain-containing protein n=1 Tax=uncultured Friedmanniella sp. TaxID=335381 RepID=UPI0035CA27BD